jgi:hypothetical protein
VETPGHASANCNNVTAGGNASSGAGAQSYVRITCAVKERPITDSCVTGARHVAEEGEIAERVIRTTVYIRLERLMTKGVIEVTARIVKEREKTDGVVIDTVHVVKESKRSIGRVAATTGIA